MNASLLGVGLFVVEAQAQLPLHLVREREEVAGDPRGRAPHLVQRTPERIVACLPVGGAYMLQVGEVELFHHFTSFLPDWLLAMHSIRKWSASLGSLDSSVLSTISRKRGSASLFFISTSA